MTPQSELTNNITKAIKKYYKQTISENIKRGIAEAKKRKNNENKTD